MDWIIVGSGTGKHGHMPEDTLPVLALGRSATCRAQPCDMRNSAGADHGRQP